ncbi:hypothetical protein HMPREF0083_00519 [Aneurinibacillus aneurinilyticus ATCC 12856]|uniref:Uncharacterized protein n=1 Tax=Aneurinibacillus aneurinilyticus ATCC 12856 TaxID=649747 RepID=U1X8U1_ANEAE|nr:hypothetical protein HMPREF0083_00519 [Aneurinibacillus aneurinilyticus ATCC 12856]
MTYCLKIKKKRIRHHSKKSMLLIIYVRDTTTGKVDGRWRKGCQY